MSAEPRLMVPTNWDPELLPLIAPFGPAYIYGSLPNERSLRNILQLPAVTLEEVTDYVEAARAKGIKFIYVMNATCGGNREMSEEGRWEVLQRCQWLKDIGGAGVVLANPYLMELVREHFPELEVHVSVLAGVNEPRKALFFQELGVSVIHLAPEVNRDFRKLKAIRRAVRCNLSVLANEGCLLHCPMKPYHGNVMSHSFESIEGRYHVDYCYFKCSLIKATDLAQYLQMPWIRPEDLGLYEELGVDYVKIAGREKMGQGPASHTAWIAKVAEAYHSRRCQDIAELLVAIEPVQSLLGEGGAAPRVHIDSRRLEGFIQFFQEGHCDMNCHACNYCGQWAAKAVRIEGDVEEYREQVRSSLKAVRIGSYWTGVAR